MKNQLNQRLQTILLATITIIFLLAAFGSTFAQKKPDAKPEPTSDFSGSWKYKGVTAENTDLLPRLSFENRKGHTITITQNESRIVLKRFDDEYTYYTDGRGETNAVVSGKINILSKTRLKGRVLTVDGVLQDVGAKDPDYRIQDEWTISKDGKKLTIRYCQISCFLTGYTYRYVRN